MCFSAEASFASFGVLTVISFGCVKYARKKPQYLFLALTPLFFAFQQFIEGLVWIGLNYSNSTLTYYASLGFLFFAFLFWLVWIPIVCYQLELIQWRKKLFLFLVMLALFYGLYIWIPLVTGNGIAILDARVCGHSICYLTLKEGFSAILTFREILYALFCCLYLLCSDLIFRKFWLLVMVFAVITFLVVQAAWYSVWCFFAAVASSAIFFLLRQLVRADVEV